MKRNVKIANLLSCIPGNLYGWYMNRTMSDYERETGMKPCPQVDCEETVEFTANELARVYKFMGWSKDLPCGTYWIEGDPYVGEDELIEIEKKAVNKE